MKEEKKFIIPNLDIILFGRDDIILTSGDDDWDVGGDPDTKIE